MARRLCLAVVAIALLVGASATDVTGASGMTPPTPACVVSISSLKFHPRHVSPGESSVVRLKARNCTRQAQQVTVTWLGSFHGSTPGIPPGCPAIDPFPQSVNVKARGSFAAHVEFLVFPSCTATGLSETARITGAGGALLAEKTAELHIS